VLAETTVARLQARTFGAWIRQFDSETLLIAAGLLAILAVGLATAPDYGMTIDEFIFEGYGSRALRWYGSGFTDRSLFDYYDVSLYGPWFQMIVAAVQSLGLMHSDTARHAVTFVVGLGGIAAIAPVGRIAVGRWAGIAALTLCLFTGHLYGHLFFNPNDVPFMAAMTWALLGVLLMSRKGIPSWTITAVAGLLTGLATATRFGGILSQFYLVGAMTLCAIDAARKDPRPARIVTAIAVRTLAALAVGLVTTVALWPYLQTLDVFGQFREAYAHFSKLYVHFDFNTWGERVSSADLPWTYSPGELAARLPEAFVILLIVAMALGIHEAASAVRTSATRVSCQGPRGLVPTLATLARSRALITVAVAALGPILFIIARHSVVFDGLRHVLFVLPPLAVIAAWALMRLKPALLRFPLIASAAAATQVAATGALLIALHPYEYAAMNVFAGGVPGARGRFDLDYWSAAGTEALRRLEPRLAASPADRPAKILMCIPYREGMVGTLFRGRAVVETDPKKADYIIETERSKCGHGIAGTVIDEVKRDGVQFARTIAAHRHIGDTQTGVRPAT
jgi:hypothetical protein